MPRVFVSCMPTNVADKRRAAFYKLTFKPLPLRKRKWKPVNDDCPICLEKLDSNGEEPDTRLTCFGSNQCDHTFHKDCVMTWLQHHRHCPICRDSGGIVGKLEHKKKKDIFMFSDLEEGSKEIPHMMILDAFFSPKLAGLKINSIKFFEQKGSVEGSRYLQKKHNIHIDVCWRKCCKSATCEHMIVSPSEFIEWYHGIPKRIRHPTMTLKNMVKHVLLPAIRTHAPHIHEHLYEHASKDENLRRYEYAVIRARQD